MIKLLKSPTTLGRTLRSGVAAVMLAGVFAGAAASPALANGWAQGHGPVGHAVVGHGYPGWHGGWYNAGWRGGRYGWPYGYAGYYGPAYYGPGYYGYAAPVVIGAPGVAISVPLIVR